MLATLAAIDVNDCPLTTRVRAEAEHEFVFIPLPACMGLLHWPLVSHRSLFCSSSGGWLWPLSEPGASELIGPEGMMALIYILAGVR
jgi:hypothetical protein